MQAERDAGGSIIQHWRPEEIKQVLGIYPSNVYTKIAGRAVTAVFVLRQQSIQMTELVKNAIEVAIEQSEEARS